MCQFHLAGNKAFTIKRRQFLFFLPSVCLCISPTKEISRLGLSQAELLVDLFASVWTALPFLYGSTDRGPTYAVCHTPLAAIAVTSAEEGSMDLHPLFQTAI